MAFLEVKNLQKRFGNTEVLKGIDFSLEKGDVLVIIGSSGSGKTTLLRCLNFLETPSGGSIAVDGQTLLDANDAATLSDKEIRKNRLHFGLVFQQFNLFPQYKVMDNLTLAPKLALREQVKAAKKADPDIDAKLRDYMCENYFDIRTFGAVMTTFVKGALNCGQVRGPVQLSFARSVNPIVPQEVTITRVAITTEADAEKKGTEMGRKHIVPYALYRAEGYVSANLARKTTGFSEDDLKLLWTAILNMFENDHSAARGKMAVRELIVFKHDSELGNAPAYKLFDSVTVQRKPDVDAARSYRDYTVTVADTLPEGVTCERLS